jgi:hypothetical protein
MPLASSARLSHVKEDCRGHGASLLFVAEKELDVTAVEARARVDVGTAEVGVHFNQIAGSLELYCIVSL